MKQVFLFLLLCPMLLTAQNTSRFEKDTLYTSSGFKIYPGQTLSFGKLRKGGIAAHVNIKNGIALTSLENNSVVVTELSNYTRAMFGYQIIDVKGSIVFRDGSNGTIIIELAYDLAIGSRLPGTRAPELILPPEFSITKEKAAALYLPAFENDTLYTSCGYKIYKGQVLQFGKITGSRGKFKYVNIKNGVQPKWLQDNKLNITGLKEFGISALGNGYIYITGTIKHDNREIDIEVHLAFDNAIGHSTTEPGELLVPEEYRSRIKAGTGTEDEKEK